MATVYIPTPMRKLTNGQSMVKLAGATIDQLFEALEAQYPGMQAQLYDENAQLKRFIAVFVNGHDIRDLNQRATPIREQDEVYIVPAIAGGSNGTSGNDPETAYADASALVDTEWVAQHLEDPKVRIVEVDYEPTSAYALNHIPGSVLFDWRRDLNAPVRRDIVSRELFEHLNGQAGISPDTTVVLYGDYRNWFATFAFWIYKLYGHADVRLLNGGRTKWIKEQRPVTDKVPTYDAVSYQASDLNTQLRVHLIDVLGSLDQDGAVLIDVRSPAEYSGEVTAPAEYPTEAAQRGGHIPGAINVPWSKALNDDDTFKSRDELRTLYEGAGARMDHDVITYCRIGERAAVTWFVLRHLLGYPNVRNYDGSWSEWGNTIGLPIVK